MCQENSTAKNQLRQNDACKDLKADEHKFALPHLHTNVDAMKILRNVSCVLISNSVSVANQNIEFANIKIHIQKVMFNVFNA